MKYIKVEIDLQPEMGKQMECDSCPTLAESKGWWYEVIESGEVAQDEWTFDHEKKQATHNKVAEVAAAQVEKTIIPVASLLKSDELLRQYIYLTAQDCPSEYIDGNRVFYTGYLTETIHTISK